MSLQLLHLIAESYLRNPFFLVPRSSAREVTLLLHQSEVVAYALLMNPVRVLVADVIGLGKTIEGLRILYALKTYHGDSLKRVLVIVPSVLEKQWEYEMQRFGFTPVKLTHENLARLRRGELDGWLFLGRMDTLKKDEYFNMLKEVEWDAIVIDEAHKIEDPGIIRFNYVLMARELKASHLILLTATPHRGRDEHYLALLSALDPDLAPLTKLRRGRSTTIVDVDFYRKTHNVLIFRRTKRDVNNIYEQREVFKPAKMLNVLLKPSDLELELLDGLVAIGREILTRYNEIMFESGGQIPGKYWGLTELVSILIAKRGMSSPLALANTLSRVATKRGIRTIEAATEENIEKIEELGVRILESLDPEKYMNLDEEPDKLYEEFADFLLESELVSDASRDKLYKYYKLACDIVHGDYVDTKVEFIARLVEIASGIHGEKLPEELGDLLHAKIIVFTEFKDTAKYIYEKLVKRLGKVFTNPEAMLRVLTSDNKDDIRDVVSWLSNPGVKVLVATDVMSEGLNLQEANVVVNYEIVYSPVKLEQRIGRVWRYGQRRTVYVFNLFYLHPREKRIHDIFFRKVYAITESLGKPEFLLGEELYVVGFQNTVFDKLLEERLGDRGREVVRFIEATSHLSKKKTSIDEEVAKSMLKDTEQEYTKILDRLAEELVSELLEVARAAERMSLYPGQSSRGEIEETLHALWGVRNSEEAGELASKLYDIYMSLTEDVYKPDNHVDRLHAVLSRTPRAGYKLPLYYVLTGASRRLYVLYRVPVLIGNREISDLVLVEADIANSRVESHRGLRLVEAIGRLLSSSMQIDEVYGNLVHVVKLLPTCAVVAKEAIRVEKVLSRVREYEEAKNKLLEQLGAVGGLFTTKAEFGEPEIVAVFFTPDMLPRSHAPSTSVWGGFEKKYLTEIVSRFERESGRNPELVHLEEHYDVYSIGGGEERFIECKGFAEPRIDFQLTESEYLTAKELGDRYWLYLVYGVGTDSPVVLAIRNPVHKLRLVPEVYEVRMVRYRFSPVSQ